MLNNPEESLVDSRKRKVMEVQRLWFFLLVIPTLLVACGGEREEPFDPGEPDEEIREPVNHFEHFSDRTEDPINWTFVETDGRRLEIMDNVEDYGNVIDNYTDVLPEEPNFEEGQVLLYDSGWIDDSICEQQLDLRRLDAHAITEDESLVEVTLTYRRNAADETEECDEQILYRSFEFHYIETRGDIVIVEEIQGLSGNTSSSSSTSQSSSSQN